MESKSEEVDIVFDSRSQECLEKLQKLKKKVNDVMQTHENKSGMYKYRLKYEVSQPRTLIGGILKPHQLESL